MSQKSNFFFCKNNSFLWQKNFFCGKKRIIFCRKWNIFLWQREKYVLSFFCHKKIFLEFLSQKKKIIFAAKKSRFFVTKTYFFLQNTIFLWVYVEFLGEFKISYGTCNRKLGFASNYYRIPNLTIKKICFFFALKWGVLFVFRLIVYKEFCDYIRKIASIIEQ